MSAWSDLSPEAQKLLFEYGRKLALKAVERWTKRPLTGMSSEAIAKAIAEIEAIEIADTDAAIAEGQDDIDGEPV